MVLRREEAFGAGSVTRLWNGCCTLRPEQGAWTKGSSSDALLSQCPEGGSPATASASAFAILELPESDTPLPNTKQLD